MKKNPFAPDLHDLPDSLPIFPLAGVLLLPCGDLPLNIFEPRYLAMVDEAMASHRLIGMVQPRHDVSLDAVYRPVYEMGCAGKIVDFRQEPDGRYMISLSGISRFEIVEELPQDDAGYRRVKPSWKGFEQDIHQHQSLKLNREELNILLKTYFDLHEMSCDWNAIDNTPDGRLITCLSMVCPFSAFEKQALLEAEGCYERAELFMKMLDMEIRFQGASDSHKH